MKNIRIGKKIRPYLQKAKDSSLLAVEVYNKPAVTFRSAAYISLMVIAWTSLIHSIFFQKGVYPFYKRKNGRCEVVDGDTKHWDLAECVKQLWGSDISNPIRKNIEFFIPLRNKIEHRHIPELDSTIFGECQALLLNFDQLLGEYFGPKHQIRESLSFSLQMYPRGETFAQAVKNNKNIGDIKRFIDDYRGMLSTDTFSSTQFSFKAFLIQVGNNNSQDALPIQFIHLDQLDPEQKQEFDKFAVMVKMKSASTINGGLLKPKEVVKSVQLKLGDPKVNRYGKIINKFNQDTHSRCWKKYEVRPPSDSKKPAVTNKKFCVYDEPHRDYLYTNDWVEFLVNKIKNETEYGALFN